jgi:hypothetical protein
MRQEFRQRFVLQERGKIGKKWWTKAEAHRLNENAMCRPSSI